MPRYHFHVRDGAVIDDPVGSEFADWNEARNEAFRRATLILKEYRSYQEGPPWQMRVVDDAGQAVLTIGFQAKFAEVDIPA